MENKNLFAAFYLGLLVGVCIMSLIIEHAI